MGCIGAYEVWGQRLGEAGRKAVNDFNRLWFRRICEIRGNAQRPGLKPLAYTIGAMRFAMQATVVMTGCQMAGPTGFGADKFGKAAVLIRQTVRDTEKGSPEWPRMQRPRHPLTQ
jgi:hypothetical protein